MAGPFETERPWHALSAREALADLNANEDGLDTDEVVRRLAIFGRNELPKRRRTPFIVLWLRQFKSPLIYLLLAAGGFAIGIGDYKDAVLIIGVLIVNDSIGAVQEWKAAGSASALDALITERVVVRRSGHRGVIESAGLVPGDIVEFESGAHVPADVRLLGAHEQADEAARIAVPQLCPVVEREDRVRVLLERCGGTAPQESGRHMEACVGEIHHARGRGKSDRLWQKAHWLRHIYG